MANFNKVIVMGNVTRDLDVRKIPSGMSVVDVGMAVNDRRKDKNGNWVEDPVFLDVTVWGKMAEAAGQFLHKGSPVFFEGRLKLESWEQDGQKRSKLKVVAEKMQLLGPKPSNGQQTPPVAQVQQPVATTEDPYDLF